MHAGGSHRKPSAVGRWLKRIAWTIVGIAVALAIAGAIYQAVATRQDAQRFPQRGKSVDIGGFSLNLDCAGTGSPTVILESGLGAPAAGWALVQPDVAKFTRVCSYDRAGYGWSDPSPLPHTSLAIAKELHALLLNAGIAPPYILVGHSFGGFNVRVYAGQYPDEVAGVVLVDSSHEDQKARMPAKLREWSEATQVRRLEPFIPLLIRLGVVRLLLRHQFDSIQIPQPMKDELRYLSLQSQFVHAVVAESVAFDESAQQARAAGTLGDKPLIVLTAGRSLNLPDMPAAEMQAFRTIWVNELQPSLARLSTRGQRIMVEQSDHLIPFEQPQAIVSAIRLVMGASTAPAATPRPKAAAKPAPATQKKAS
ncbi:MAG TPA: alpha/beta hydrolase [Candidatus Acidoferrales bacterium]|jgi:pimeloyl-ACP methyl ester carboxylesterase|nr:alpha/beta hydrolase [Candidatus Acidoferrales bacterium]